MGLRSDEPAVGQDPPDRRDRGSGAEALLEVEGDRGRAGVVPGALEFLGDLDDLVLDLDRGPLRAGVRTPGPRRERRVTFTPVAADESIDPLPGQPVVGRDLPGTPMLALDAGPASREM